MVPQGNPQSLRWPCAQVLDPFAGGGAIPLEAMRLGCEVTAMDINPVAWFILKCTLEYPQKLAGQARPLPEFALADREFMETFLKAKGFKGARLRTFLERLGHGKGEGTQLGRIFRVRFAILSGPGLARPCLGPLGAGPCPAGVGFLLSHLRRVSTLDSYRRRRTTPLAAP